MENFHVTSSSSVSCHCYLVRFHDSVGLKVGRLLHEASHQQHGFAFGLQTSRVCQ